MKIKWEMLLHDVLEEKEALPVTVTVQNGGQDDGIVVSDGDGQRVMVENHNGALTVHIWAQPDAIDNDPTHSIGIERR